MAKKFKYQFENILKLKEYNTSLAKESLNFVLKIKYEKEELLENYHLQIEEAKKVKFDKTPAFLLQTVDNNAKFLNLQIQTINEEIKELEEIIKLRRIKLTEAMKEEKIMVKIKEKKLLDYNYELLKEENASFDEIASRRFININNSSKE